MITRIRKAIFPAAGLGTRFLPATKAIPKEMLTVVDKPLIQYGVEEALNAGIEQIIFVTGAHKLALADHFKPMPELESYLQKRHKEHALRSVQEIIPKHCSMSWIRQEEPLGLGHAIWCARHLIDDEPFAVLLPDDLFQAQTPILTQLVDQFNRVGHSMLALMEVAPEETQKYGIVDMDPSDRLKSPTPLRGIVEKPSPDKAPSTLAVVGRYILTPEIFTLLEKKQRGAGGEIQLTDAIDMLMTRQPIYGHQCEGVRFDCGDKTGFQMANITFALKQPSLRAKLLPFLANLQAQGETLTVHVGSSPHPRPFTVTT